MPRYQLVCCCQGADEIFIRFESDEEGDEEGDEEEEEEEEEEKRERGKRMITVDLTFIFQR